MLTMYVAEENAAQEDEAIDLWIGQSLRRAYGTVAAEPIPAGLLLLIKEHRSNQDGSDGQVCCLSEQKRDADLGV
jgi:hypothetical protein